MNGPLFSVIIPVYNRADLVATSVRSALDQTVEDLEVVVVDDGSTDGTRAALEPYLDRIRYFHQNNAGVAAARNRGIAESRGRFLAFLDSDDSFLPTMLERVRDAFEQHPEVGAVFTAEIELDAQGREGRAVTKKTPGPYFSTPGMIEHDTLVGSGRPGVVPREWVERLGGYDESLGCAVDSDLWIRYSFHMPMVLQPEPLVLRRWHPGNLMLNRLQDAKDWLRILEKTARDHPEFVSEHPGVYRRTLAKNYLRLGRELMAAPDPDRTTRGEARRALRRSFRVRPFRPKTLAYLACSYVVPPSLFRRWRAWELRRVHHVGRKVFSDGGDAPSPDLVVQETRR